MAAVLYTLGSVTIPSLASVYNELALKKHMDTSVHLQVTLIYPPICPARPCLVTSILPFVTGMLPPCVVHHQVVLAASP